VTLLSDMSKDLSDEVRLAKQPRKREPSILLLLKDKTLILVLNDN
jgi:hypothetical protein